MERFFRGDPLPSKTCIVTFDDGYLDNYVYAYPVLKEFGMTALLFVVTGWLGDGLPRRHGETLDHNECQRRVAAGAADSVMLRWSEVEAMAAAGACEFHSHTHSHTRWDKTIADPGRRALALGEDLSASRTALQARLGRCSSHLCWPQGYYDDVYVEAAVAAGFEHLYTTVRRLNTSDASPRSIGRFATKERGGGWLVRRTHIYATPWLAGIYAALRGESPV